METSAFWDMEAQFRKKLKEGATDEARRMLYNMTLLYPQLDDNDLLANKAIIHAALGLDKVIPDFNLAYFVDYAMRLADTDWSGMRRNGRVIPSLGQRITNRLMAGIGERPDHFVKAVMPFFRKALQHNPSNKDNLRHLAQLYVRVKLKAQAVALYKQLLQRYHDSYLYAELSDLVADQQLKAALLAQAIANQPREAFNMAYRYRLAELLHLSEPARAAYEIARCIAARTKQKLPVPSHVERIARIVADCTPVTEEEQKRYYEAAKPRVERFVYSRP